MRDFAAIRFPAFADAAYVRSRGKFYVALQWLSPQQPFKVVLETRFQSASSLAGRSCHDRLHPHCQEALFDDALCSSDSG